MIKNNDWLKTNSQYDYRCTRGRLIQNNLQPDYLSCGQGSADVFDKSIFNLKEPQLLQLLGHLFVILQPLNFEPFHKPILGS